MKKYIFIILVICLLFTGCSNAEDKPEAEEISESAEATETVPEADLQSETTENPEASVAKIFPLPDTTMDNLDNAILSISLEEDDAYVDDTGKMQMDVKIYSYDKYDMVDISILKVGDIIVSHAGEVEIASIERKDNGLIYINGGLDADGFELATGDNGIFYEQGYNDAKNWYEVGMATIRVSVDFRCHDTSALEKGEVLYYPGSFLIGEVTDYNFTPYNTTIRVENGQVVEMHRVYIP